MELGAGDLPPGFRFHPTAEEIIIHYLLNKVIDESFVSIPIREVVDLNKCEPWDLPQKAKMGENEWYFFYQKDRKYARGRRSNRATKLGYWKATGKDREIYKKGAKSSCLVGMKKTLVFYMGRAPKGERSNWVMHEYRLEGNFSDYNFSNTAKEAWVVCRVFHKKTINGTSDDILPGVEVAKLESDHSPTVVLPQLTVDYSCFTERSPTFPTKEAESAAASGQQQLSKLMSNNISPQLKTHQNHLFPFWDPINNLNSTSIFSRQIVHPQYYSSLGHDQPHVSRIFAPDNYINMTGEYDQAKLGTFSSFNNSIISTHDLVKVCDDQALPSCPSMPDLDSLWN